MEATATASLAWTLASLRSPVALAVAACAWLWHRSGGGGVGRCSPRRPRRASMWCRWTLRRRGSRARSSRSCMTSTSMSRRPSCSPPPAAPPLPTPSSHDQRRLLDKLVLYGLVELKVSGDGNCQVVNQHSRMYKKQSASVHARAPNKDSGGDADGRREVRGLYGVVVADV